MDKVNIHEAKTKFSRLVQRAAAGEEIVIAKAGVPVARLVPFRRKRRKRRLGLYPGAIRIHDDFDDLPEDIRAAFEGEET
jgi:prevent-host-death family protein